jgi:hypothetical protein
MNSTTFSLLSNSNSKIDGNQITFGAVDFQPHLPTLAPVFASLDQEMDLTIRSPNFHVGSLGSVRLSDPINSGPSVGKIASAAKSGALVGSSSEVNSSISIKPTKNRERMVKELDEIMENLDLGESSDYSDMDSDENFDNNFHPGKDFMICCDSISNKSTNTWKIGLELYDDDQTFFSSSSSSVNHQYQVFPIISDNSEEIDDNNNPVINPANVTRGANHMAELDTMDSVATRAKV